MSIPGLRKLRALRILFALFLLAASSLVYRPSSYTPSAHAQATKASFVTVQAGQLIYGGSPITLKGTNFYPKDRPWADMWKRWDGASTQTDLAHAQELGANTVRILVPYKPVNGWTDKDTGAVNPAYLNALQQFVQIAGNLNMKVIIALFDFYDPANDAQMTPSMPAAESARRNLLYLDTIIPVFANDDRVLAWDLHNEPDQYATWNDLRDPAASIAWIGRMAAEIKRLDHNHLLTVGIRDFSNLFVADAKGAPTLEGQPTGPTVADLSDFLSFHSYNAGNMDWQITYIRAHSNKPLVLQETGWPTGPACTDPAFSEQQQSYLYNIMVSEARKFALSGMMQWQLWDLPPGASQGAGRETNEDYYGLLRQNGTWKPAMTIFRDGWPGKLADSNDPNSTGPIAPASPMPSATHTDLPFTTIQVNVPADPNNPAPLFFPETGHYIYTVFRAYWLRFGGLDVFGYPLTEQRLEGDYWVQYFERARFEYHPENTKIQGFASMGKAQQYLLLVQLSRLGATLVSSETGGKGYPAIEPSAAPTGATYFPETGHSISGKIAEYWRANNGLTNFGYPLSEPVVETSQADGKQYTVQYFERTRLEYHPENAGTPYEIELGLLGRETLASKGCR